VVGRHAPEQKQMGHSGALIGSAREGADAKLAALAAGGCRIAKGLQDAVQLLSEYAG
jgi:succinyl-CoA synthetase alpha subunit